jgi:hypothetical protein
MFSSALVAAGGPPAGDHRCGGAPGRAWHRWRSDPARIEGVVVECCSRLAGVERGAAGQGGSGGTPGTPRPVTGSAAMSEAGPPE